MVKEDEPAALSPSVSKHEESEEVLASKTSSYETLLNRNKDSAAADNVAKTTSEGGDEGEGKKDRKFSGTPSAGGQSGRNNGLVSGRRIINYDKLIRPKGETHAMQGMRRVWKKLVAFLTCTRREPEQSSLQVQYRIPPRENARVSLIELPTRWIEPKIAKITTWNFRSGFITVIIVFLAAFIICIYLFALIIYGVVNRTYKVDGVECLDGWNYDDSGMNRANFELAFSLSWTTLSTVGYGTISPPAEDGCTRLRFLCAMIAFLGVLYSGFCGAIFFAKVMMLHAEAHVTFSNVICLQFGADISEASRETNNKNLITSYNEDEFHEAEKASIQACPFLEFRIVNDRANERLGEILDASIECVVCEYGSLGKLSTRGKNGDGIQESVGDADLGPNETTAKVLTRKQLLHQLKVDPEQHPFFKHVWYCRHVLDEDSPLVKPEIRKYIARNGGWPAEVNDHSKIRDYLEEQGFQIIATFNGTDRLTSASCFKVKRYVYEDIYIGWQFAEVYYQTDKNNHDAHKIGVDLELVHDISPQNGGGHEPLGSQAAAAATAAK